MSFSIIIPSASGPNLVQCVNAIRKHEPDLPPDKIIVIDDGARAHAGKYLPGLTWIKGLKPFIFARAVNMGLRACSDNVVVMGDDVLLTTPSGFSRLVTEIGEWGIISPGIRGGVGNTNQNVRPGVTGVLEEKRDLCFVCVLIPRRTIQQLGEMDEQFTGYGCDDIDYCRRAMAAGMKMAVNHNCVVHHGLHSVYRSRPNIGQIHTYNKGLFRQKWGKQ